MRTRIAIALAFVAAACGSSSPSRPTVPPDLIAPAPAPATATIGDDAPATTTTPPAPGGALTDAQVEDLGGRIVTMMERVAAAVTTHAADCPQMATAIDQVLTDSQAVLADARAADGNPDNEGKFQAWADRNQARFQALTDTMGAGISACAGDPGVQAAFGRLEI